MAALSPTGAPRKWLVRALFAAVFLYFCAGVILRKAGSEPFPALLMPSFAGTGLESMAGGRGTTRVSMITVEFADGYNKRVSLTDFSPPEFFELTLPRQIFLPQSAAARAKLSTGERLKLTLDAVLHGPPAAVSPDPARPLTSEVVEFLRDRTAELFPGRKAERITFRSCVVSFPLDQPKDRQILDESDTTIELGKPKP